MRLFILQILRWRPLKMTWILSLDLRVVTPTLPKWYFFVVLLLIVQSFASIIGFELFCYRLVLISDMPKLTVSCLIKG